jgi:hypothetical protein
MQELPVIVGRDARGLLLLLLLLAFLHPTLHVFWLCILGHQQPCTARCWGGSQRAVLQVVRNIVCTVNM